MYKGKIPCSIGAFSVAWKYQQLHQSWQSRMHHSHDQNPCIHHLCQHIVRGRELVLEHPSSNNLEIKWIYQYPLSAHFVLLCWGWKVWATRTGLSRNAHYCSFRGFYAYVTFNKSSTLPNSRTYGFWSSVWSVCTCFPFSKTSWVFC